MELFFIILLYMSGDGGLPVVHAITTDGRPFKSMAECKGQLIMMRAHYTRNVLLTCEAALTGSEVNGNNNYLKEIHQPWPNTIETILRDISKKDYQTRIPDFWWRGTKKLDTK